MTYRPQAATAYILDRALYYIRSVAYQVTARWLFYRLLQDGTFRKKTDYKKLLSYLSDARKSFYGEWRPDTLTDDTRAVNVRGNGFKTPDLWRQAISRVPCRLDRWEGQKRFVEIWFEAAAMSSQFEYHANENISLLAFHGDVSIPEKWKAAARLVDRWRELQIPATVFYYGDLDPKGISIPQIAATDVQTFAAYYIRGTSKQWREEYGQFLEDFTFQRVGLNRDDITRYKVPQNPERPGTYQWEGLDDAAAAELIGEANSVVDLKAFEVIKKREAIASQKFRTYMSRLKL